MAGELKGKTALIAGITLPGLSARVPCCWELFVRRRGLYGAVNEAGSANLALRQ